jgi:rhamnulokinase
MAADSAENYVAVDLGAESGRIMLARFNGDRLALEEVSRFPNGPVRAGQGLYWDILRLWDEVKAGIARCAAQAGPGGITALGVDTWGVDFALLDRDGELLGLPHHYRDPRTQGMMDEAFRRVPREEIFATTGIQFMPINTLYQLMSLVVRRSPLLDAAAMFLTIPDLLNFWLTGWPVCEFTNATTTQLYDPRAGHWARPLMERLDIPPHIFPEIVPPGTILGELAAEVAEETGAGRCPVIAPACHDTGSAVAAVPVAARRPSPYAYISSGTWSLVGTEVQTPVITPRSLELNFTNEGGVGATFRLLKNVMGLWLVQECRRAWARQGRDYTYDQLIALAAQAAPLQALVDPDHADFLAPGDMPARLRTRCRTSGQPEPQDPGAVVRCVLESLALKYRLVLEQLDELLGRRVEPVHVVGGGARNRLLCRFTADATGRVVLAGPTEATALGNVLVQAMARGRLASLAEGRELVRRSFDIETYTPNKQVAAAWNDAYARFRSLLSETAAPP